MRIGALEAGGTKMVMGVFDEEGHLLNSTKIPTRAPADTMPEIIAYFQEQNIEKLGVGTFGPVDLNKLSPTYGYITTGTSPAPPSWTGRIIPCSLSWRKC